MKVESPQEIGTQLQSTARRVGPDRLIRLLVTVGIPPLWLEIMLLHYRGSFQNPFMWVPVMSLPAVFLGGLSSLLVKNENRSRAIFRPFAGLMAVLGAAGTFFHLRGVGRQMGGFYNWKTNVVTGPPFPAPAQVMVMGSVGSLASLPGSWDKPRRSSAGLHLAAALSYLLLAVESGYNHWVGHFFNKFMFVPLVLSPFMALLHLLNLARVRLARLLLLPFSVLAALAGLVGFGFHIWNVGKRKGGFSWQNLFYGAPIAAPLQLSALGILGLLIWISRGRE